MSFSGRRVSILRPGNRRFSLGKELSENELRSETHRQFRSAHEGHRPHAGLDASRASTGVVWCTERATEHGYAEDPSAWANLGQGAPEADDEIEGSFPRPTSIPITSAAREYGPTAGIKPLRAAVARLYNEHYRQGKESQYTWENVCIVPGGRAGLIRIAAILGNSYLSFPIPDYSAYSEMLTLFKNIAPIPIPLAEDDHYHIHPDKIAEEIARGTSVLLTSNPRNPTGDFVGNEELARIQDICRDRATLILDEFYGGYNYTTDCDGTTISGAEHVVDVNQDDVLLIDGLTKRFRLPGWRIAWVVGPKEFVDALGSAGSYLDGGANVPFQEAAIPMLEPSLVRAEMKALQTHFREKRDFVLQRLHEIGFRVKDVPQATFYIWLDLTSLEPPLPKEANISDGLNFFNALLTEKVIVVPGIFFDLNPAKRRDLFDSPCHHFVRLSYGPKMEVLKMGLDGIERVIRRARAQFEPRPEDEVASGAGANDAQYDVCAIMALNLERFFNLTFFTFLSAILFFLIILTPADAIYQCYITRRLTNIFIITGGYVVTFILAILIYATRLYTNRTVLSGIPKAWIPVEKEDVGKSVRRLVKQGLAHSAIIAYQARPRDLAADGDSFADYESLRIDREHPPWGQIEHPGWSSPSCADLPDLSYRTVIQELPHLIEAKAVSLAPPDPIFAGVHRSLRAPFSETDESFPDTRVVEVLRRPVSMGLREYLQHLASLDVIQPPGVGAEFIALYERARFSSRELHENEFRELMHVFAELLRGMRGLNPQVLLELQDGRSSVTESESIIGPSDEEGETETLDSFQDSESVSRGRRSSSLRPSNASSWDARSTRHGRWSPVWPRRPDTRHTMEPPRTPSMRSLRRLPSNVSGSSGGSVIHLVEARRPTDLPYAFNHESPRGSVQRQ
ncbi:putative aminotransferase, classes I and II [Aspergillus saccharolyticus JOP 1030-1]|uniref:Defect at low temperature protein 1 n=1 Tax=Aspergillus saccharolyticus JOP 1030-1 TaxID=1450539 RepID=A0A318ZDA0_9EURO|nr:putative aminotransferase, classes I and II [Aspergillus saccharolyticus JOP 1030-1]PYH45309.1 putative aminotransferase, classes I and II [Aspergillus saccharolyticus JOP 1030-1]